MSRIAKGSLDNKLLSRVQSKMVELICGMKDEITKVACTLNVHELCHSHKWISDDGLMEIKWYELQIPERDRFYG